MTVSETSIANIALARIGGWGDDGMLLDVRADPNKAARVCRIFFDDLRDAMLREHPWNFAIKRAELAALVTKPTFEYLYAYQLPSDFLCMVRTNYEADGYIDVDYRIEGSTSGSPWVVTDESTMKVEYVARITDPNQWDAQFRDCFAQRLAAELAMPLANSNTLAERLMKVYEDKIRLAWHRDAQEGVPRVIEASDWVVARL